MTFTYEAPVTTYNIYDGYVISNVLSIMWQSVGPSEEWIPVRRWSWTATGGWESATLTTPTPTDNSGRVTTAKHGSA